MMQAEVPVHLVIGLGQTGYSCAKFLVQNNIPVAVMDNRKTPPFSQKLKKEFPNVVQYLGEFTVEEMKQAKRLVVSPGVSLATPEIAEAVHFGVPAIGDIELFAENNTAPVIAITGTNGKSTVTTLVGEMLTAAGYNACIAGNIGNTVLDDTNKDYDCYVLELSSFQLETTYQLQPKIAAILNLSHDHLDRYNSYQDYVNAKQRIFHLAEHAVCFLDQPETHPAYDANQTFFTLAEPQLGQWGIRSVDNEYYLARGNDTFLATSNMRLKGKQNWLNALSAAAIASIFGVDLSYIKGVLEKFPGLEHRCQWLRTLQDVDWYNDSKGTNVGASLAAIEGIGETISGKIVLIAGGQAKDADFSPLTDSILRYVKQCILIGEDASKIEAATPNSDHVKAIDLEDAVRLAHALAVPGDVVLLSPACASFDMFKNFEHRGDRFSQLVRELS